MLNTTLLSLLVIVIGYSTYALILIRSTADTPMNQNNPNNIFTLRYYLAREQYGETPLLYGSTYVSELKRKRVGDYLMSDMKKGDPTWTRVIKTNPNDKDKYFISTYSQKPVYIDETCTLFPRMYSGEASHVEGYKQWGDVKGTPVKINQFGENKTVMKPTFGENLRFFFDYQLNFMYWRYFLWNFSGRQNDIQGYGGILNGNWITGIKFLDAARLGPQDNMPVDIANNKAHNVFYMLPLILGLIGIAFQLLRKDEKGTQNFLIVFFLFFMTGIAIVMYLNQTPYQPRERDYAYAGSFYAFCIWIGLGVAGIAEALKKLKLSPVVINCIASLVCLIVPLQMASQTWDDHDRSGRTAARDFGRNYLESCDPNAVIITYGDNDTFPLWYVQEVEGVRTDVRVCNSSYAQTDWYINQMKRQAYNSAPLPISMTHDKYIQGGARDGIYIVPKVNQPIELGAALNFVLSDDPKTKIDYVGELNSYFPANKLVLKVDSAAVVATNTISSPYYPFIQKELELSLEGKNVIQKFDLALLDLVYTNQWKRPVYFATTVPPNIYAMYGNYMQKTGLAWQIVPMNTKGTYLDVNTDKMYENVMNKFRFGGIDKPGLYLDPTVMNMCKAQRQTVFGDLARNLIQEGKIDSAKQVLDKCVAVFPEFNVPYDYSIGPIAEMYYKVGEKEKAQAIYKRIIANNLTDVEWMLSLRPSLKAGITDELDREMNLLRYQLGICYQYDKDFAEPYIGHFNVLMEQYQPSSANK
jgi:tetratricopeptide (TPR) repeat protein